MCTLCGAGGILGGIGTCGGRGRGGGKGRVGAIVNTSTITESAAPPDVTLLVRFFAVTLIRYDILSPRPLVCTMSVSRAPRLSLDSLTPSLTVIFANNGAPAGGHADIVISLALAWSAVSGQHRLIFSVPDRDIVVPEFPIPEHWPRVYGLDIRWHTAAAIWGARDPQSDVVYLCSEYWGDADAAVHLAAIRARAEWIPGLIDLAANGRDRGDGVRLIQMYQGLGLNLQHIEKLDRVRNHGDESTNAIRASEGLPLTGEVSGRAQALSA
jgi:hypothetical protein